MKSIKNFLGNIKNKVDGFTNRRHLKAWHNYVLMSMFAVGLTLVEFIYSTEGTSKFIYNMQISSVFFWLNLFPVFATVFLVYFLTNSLRVSVILNFLFYHVIFIVNRIKILFRNEPLFVSDLRLGVESVTITKGQNYSPGAKLLLFSAVILVLLIVAVYYFKPAKSRPAVRAIGAVSVVLASYAMYVGVYVNQPLYGSMLPHVSIYSDRDSAENKGILYYLLYSAQFSKITEPDGYDRSEFAGIVSDTVDVAVKPNVLMVMGEAYFDLSDLDIFEFEGVSPTQNFDRLSEEALLSGRIVVPSFGGGTADTEFDVLTGCQTIRCAPNMTYAFNSVLGSTESIATAFKKQGYFARAFHPGYNFFYKRQTVYPRLGFDDVYFVDSVEKPVMVGGFLEERLTFDEYIGRFEEHLENSDSPVFDYMVTIQNHGPYYRGKLGKNFKFESSVELSDDLVGCLEGYFQGVHEMDAELGRLAELVEDRNEPFLIVFYGDHLPSLAGGNEGYNQLGFDITSGSFDSDVRRYSTPYMVWANKSYRRMLMEQNGEAMLPDGLDGERAELISANYLGAMVLQLVGADASDDFFRNLNKLRGDFPVLSRAYVFDGEAARGYGEVSDDELYRYYRYQYYRLHD